MSKNKNVFTSPREPRSRLIGRFVEHWLDGTIEKQAAYADDVCRCYHQQIPDPGDRSVNFHVTGDAESDLRANRQIVMRALRGEVRLPSDLEEALVAALPRPQCDGLVRRLAARYGLLAVPMPLGATGSAELAELVQRFGAAVSSYGPLLDDGVIDEADDPGELDASIDETAALIAAATGFLNTLLAARRGASAS